MKEYRNLTRPELEAELAAVRAEYDALKAKGLQLNHNDAGGEALSSLLLRPSPKACAGSAGYPALFDALLLRCNLPRDAETPAGQRNKTYSAWEE